jgi:small subunit ribosomal protein S10
VGIKANIWEYEGLESATRAGHEIEEGDWSRRREGAVMQKVDEILNSRGYKESMEGHEGVKGLEMRP